MTPDDASSPLVVDEDGKVVGVLDQTEITVAYLAATARRT